MASRVSTGQEQHRDAPAGLWVEGEASCTSWVVPRCFCSEAVGKAETHRAAISCKQPGLLVLNTQLDTWGVIMPLGYDSVFTIIQAQRFGSALSPHQRPSCPGGGSSAPQHCCQLLGQHREEGHICPSLSRRTSPPCTHP